MYFLKLGIELDRIDPGRPQQNGAHERMHRTLKADTTRPPEKTFRAQQARFDHFRSEYNEIRPHQALAFETPASRYTPSLRPLPKKLPQPNYPDHAELRTITKNGTVKFKGRHYFLSETLARELVALEEIDDSIWSIYFYDFLLGRLDLRSHSFIP